MFQSKQGSNKSKATPVRKISDPQPAGVTHADTAALQRMGDPAAPLVHSDFAHLQRMLGNAATIRLLTEGPHNAPVQRVNDPAASDAPKTAEPQEASERPNRTGMPDRLKRGLESLSGYDLSDVKVHYNSAKPAKLGALAYAQGGEIHLGPGQERHLPHEGWHVVQQRQGRVQPGYQAKGAAVNDDPALEAEADAMGAKAEKYSGFGTGAPSGTLRTPLPQSSDNVAQLRTIKLSDGTDIDILRMEFSDIIALFERLRTAELWSDILRLSQEMVYAPRNYSSIPPRFSEIVNEAEQVAGDTYTKVKSDKRGHAFSMHLPSDKMVTAHEVNDSLGGDDLAGPSEEERKKVRLKLRTLYGMNPSTGEKGHFAPVSGGFLSKKTASLAVLYVSERLERLKKAGSIQERHKLVVQLFPNAVIKFAGGSKSVTKEMDAGERFIILIPFLEVFGSTPIASIWYSVERTARSGQVKSKTVKDVKDALNNGTEEVTPRAEKAWIFAIADVGSDDYAITTLYISDDNAFREENSGRDTHMLSGDLPESSPLSLSELSKERESIDLATLRMAQVRAVDLEKTLNKKVVSTPSQGLNCLIYAMAISAGVPMDADAAAALRTVLVQNDLAAPQGYIEAGIRQVQTIAIQLGITNGTFVIHNTYNNIQQPLQVVVGSGAPQYDIIHTLNHYNATL
ncbi:DUF4157 domain-containing protein [Paenibacillus hamazuiensis]|uniref:eCIS core domain-containing protein n=1 Tax=Paenibacillus hamazuiensis TaxID=2936508 RepID=UPI002010C489|nr:DUF4157 domain-containing protein [Paenibacillus hamazuiensis]